MKGAAFLPSRPVLLSQTPFRGRPPLVTRRELIPACTVAAARRVVANLTDAPSSESSPLQPLQSWDTTIANDGTPLFFAPFVAEHKAKIAALLPGLRPEPVPTGIAYQRTARKSGRIGNECFSSDHFRKIRVTCLDVGASVQVFTVMWYPRPKYDAPVLAIEFVSYAGRKATAMMDFMPLERSEEYLERFCARMERVRDRYEGLRERRSEQFYEMMPFVSKQLVFRRYEEEGEKRLLDEAFPAFVDYLDEYATMIVGGECVQDECRESVERVRQLQSKFDQYMADNDPAVSALEAYFEKEWVENYAYTFLFDQAELKKKKRTKSNELYRL